MFKLSEIELSTCACNAVMLIYVSRVRGRLDANREGYAWRLPAGEGSHGVGGEGEGEGDTVGHRHRQTLRRWIRA